MSAINAKEVYETFLGCLYRDDEITPGQVPENAVIVEGILDKIGFHPGRLEAARPKVIAWLRELPHQFREDHDEGGGWSFLNACMDQNGEQWGEHLHMDQLFCLGMGLKLVTCLLPRAVWGSLPGGMPYYSISKDVTAPAPLPSS